jgi:hypothetical protein
MRNLWLDLRYGARMLLKMPDKPRVPQRVRDFRL